MQRVYTLRTHLGFGCALGSGTGGRRRCSALGLRGSGRGQDGRTEGLEQVLPAGLRSGEDPAAEAAEESADQGADDASHEHSV